jgi:hypothetical protein
MFMLKHLVGSAAVAVVALSATSARAGFIGFLTSTSTDTYNYTLRFTPETISPPVVGQEELVLGDLVTFYNVVPSASDLSSYGVNGADASNFEVTEQMAGLTPPNLVGAAGLPAPGTTVNITFRYIGPTLTTARDFSATILTTGGFSGTRIGTGVGDTLVDYGSGFTAEKDSLYPVLLPQLGGGGPPIPEPTTLGVLAVGSLALMARRRRA